MIANIITMLCGFMTFMMCSVLVLHDDYDDGLVGRLALSIIAVAAMAGIFRIAEGNLDIVRFSPISMVAGVGVTLFFMRHAYRFLSRIGQWPYSWSAVLSPIYHAIFNKPDPEKTKH